MPNGSASCPHDPAWLRGMFENIPPGLRGELADYEHCVPSGALEQQLTEQSELEAE